jgi:DNA recombination protein RmuC
MDIAALALGFAIGCLAGLVLWFAERARSARRTAEASAETARLRAELDGERRAAAEKLAAIEDAQLRLRDAFAALASDALRQNNQSFLDLARSVLGEFHTRAATELEARQKQIADVLEPVKTSLARVDAQLQEVEKARAGSEEALKVQLAELARTQESLRAETGNLVRALRSPNVRGLWGEMQLRRVVEAAGMLRHCDFVEKESAWTEEGSRRTPDLIVRLPGGRQIVVDAKVPIDAFMKAIDAADGGEREMLFREHTRQMRAHIERLGRKAYWDQFQPSPDFVFMFLPGETLLATALEQDPNLIEFGLARRVIPATPFTLIALLRAVAYGWQQEQLAANAEEISRLGRELYDRINTVAKHFGAVGRNLREAMEAFNRAVASFESRLLVTARRFKDLGAATSEEVVELESVDVPPRALQAPEVTGDVEGS